MEKIIAAAYCRVSTAQQIESKDSLTVKKSLADQESLAREAAEKNGWEFLEAFVEPGISGEELEERPQIQRVLAAARSKKFQVLIVRHSNRLGRLQYIYHYLIHVLQVESRIQIYDLDDPEPVVDPARFNPRLDNHLTYKHGIKGMITEADQNDRTRKLKAGIENNVKAGRYLHPFAPYGYRFDLVVNGTKVERIPVPDEKEYPVLEMIIEWALEGVGMVRITKNLNSLGIKSRFGGPWNRSSIQRILKNPFYAGFMGYGKTRFISGTKKKNPNPDNPPIFVPHNFTHPMTMDQYNQLAEDRKFRLTLPLRGRKFSNPLAGGILVCGQCGCNMYYLGTIDQRIKRENKFVENFCCSTYINTQVECSYNQAPVRVVMQCLKSEINFLAEMAKTDFPGLCETILKVGTENGLKALLDQRLNLEKQINGDLPRKVSVLRARLLDETITSQEYKEMRDNLHFQSQSLEKDLVAVNAQIEKIQVTEKHYSVLDDFFKWWQVFQGKFDQPLQTWDEADVDRCQHKLSRVFDRIKVWAKYNHTLRKWTCELEINYAARQ